MSGCCDAFVIAAVHLKFLTLEHSMTIHDKNLMSRKSTVRYMRFDIFARLDIIIHPNNLNPQIIEFKNLYQMLMGLLSRVDEQKASPARFRPLTYSDIYHIKV